MLVLSLYIVTSLVVPSLTSHLRYSIREEVAVGHVVAHVGNDSGLAQELSAVFPELRFSIASSSVMTSLFNVTSQAGTLSVRTRIDREKICAGVVVCAIDMNIRVLPLEYFRIIRVTVTILDINDSIPKFPRQTSHLNISEAARVGSRYNLIAASDADSRQYGVQGYSLVSSHDNFLLSVNLQTTELALVLTAELDRETRDEYFLTIVARDGSGSDASSASMTLSVHVTDVNDNAPSFSQNFYNVSLLETSVLGFPVFQCKAEDDDLGENGRVRYDVHDLTKNRSPFVIDRDTGLVTTITAVDREERSEYRLIVTARDEADTPLESSSLLVISITDVNDNPPSIRVQGSGEGQIVIEEHRNVSTLVAHVKVSDADDSDNGKSNCTLQGSNDFIMSEVYESDYQITNSNDIDRERIKAYQMRILCKDWGIPQMTSQADFTITVSDINDNAPVFSKALYNSSVLENQEVLTRVAVVTAHDADESGTNSLVTYEIVSDDFVVDSSSGVIRANRVFDREEKSFYSFTVIARDNPRHGSQLSSTSVVAVHILDEDDNDPLFTKSVNRLYVRENVAVDTVIGSVHATDADEISRVVYAITSNQQDARSFEIDARFGSITTRSGLDREKQDRYKFTVTASSATVTRAVTATALVIVEIQDVNDNAPTIIYPSTNNDTVYVSSRVPRRHVVASVTAQDPDDGDNALLQYKMVPDNESDFYFNIDTVTGDIFCDTDELSVDGESSYRIIVQDSGFIPLSTEARLTIHVNDSVHFVVTTSAARVGELTVTLTLISSALLTTLLLAAIVVVSLQIRHQQGRARDQHALKTAAESSTARPASHTTSASRVQNSAIHWDNITLDTDIVTTPKTMGNVYSEPQAPLTHSYVPVVHLSADSPVYTRSLMDTTPPRTCLSRSSDSDVADSGRGSCEELRVRVLQAASRSDFCLHQKTNKELCATQLISNSCSFENRPQPSSFV